VHDEAVARSILSATDPGQPAARLERLGDGFASDAWLVDRDGADRAVLRIANGRGLSDVTYEMEHALMGRLYDRDAAVPRPILGSWELPRWDGPAFSLTSWAPGEPLRPASIARAVPAIARFIAALRALPVASGYGPLIVEADGTLRGARDDRSGGLVAWAERPFWPLDGSRLAEHPAIGEHPSLVSRMDATADVVRAALLDGPVAVLHSDFHEGNILDDDGALTFIDFGEALVGPIAWDIAAIGFFMDWATVDAVAGGDTAMLVAAARIGLAFGAYRWHLSREHAFDDDEHDRGYLETCLERMGPG
jgi:Ser/Thr protein kinase RdoA (MazF antagonist)